MSDKSFIYRIISRDRLFQLFDNGENVLVAPSKWEDPFENFILRAPIQLNSGEWGDFSFHDDFYGQCWTLHKSSDAMWRIYSPGKNAVRIRTSIKRLGQGLSVHHGQWAHMQCYVGRVEYLSESKLRKFSERVFKGGLSPKACARSLLVKRWAFKHEREIRLLYFEKKKEKWANGLYRYRVDPHDLIDQIMIDPRLPVSEAETFKDEIRTKTGFKGEIKRSLLYAPPKGFVIRLP
ncbi:MAG: DUF2971 domain-containing protein [Alphaproteobacteria bacterium]